MLTQNAITTVDNQDYAYWPEEAQLADFARQSDHAEKGKLVEQADRSIENNPEYATLYFVS